MARSALRPLLILAPLLLPACGGDAPPPDAPPGEPVPSSSPQADAPAGILPADERLFAIEGLMGPEAVKYDPDQDVYIISNFGDSEDPEANDGFLSRAAAADGAMETLRWAVGDESRPLLQPRGMAISGDSVWVADARGLHAFHRESGDQLTFVDLTALEPGFLNDVAVGPDGAVYVTDTGTSRLIRLTATGGDVVAEGEELGSPNGITLDPSTGRLVLVPWAGGDSLRAWDPGTGEVTILARSPGGRFDGVEMVNGAMVVASQVDSALHVVRDGVGRPYQKVPGAPADIAVDTRRGRVAVPYINLNRVDVFEGVGGG